MPTRSNWYSDHPSACQCKICSDIRNFVKEETKDTDRSRYGEEQIMDNKFRFKKLVIRLIFGLVVLVIASVALIYYFQTSNEISDLTSDKASLQEDVDTKAKKVSDLTSDKASLQEDVGRKAKQITLLNDQKASLQKILDSLRLPAPIRTEEIKQGYFESQEFLVLKFDVITQQDIVFEVICDIYCEAHIKDPHGEMVKDFRLESPDKRIRDETYSFKDAKITGPYSVYLKNPFTCWNECPYKVTRVAYTKYK